MKGLLQLVVMAALVASFSGNATKHCVTKKNEHGVRITVCDGKVMPHHSKKSHHIERKRHCVTKIDAEGKKVTTCTGKAVKKSH